MDILVMIVIVIIIIVFAGVYFAACAFLGWLADAEAIEQRAFEDEVDQ